MLIVIAAATLGTRLTAWAYMWMLALAMYAASKWITWQPYAAGQGFGRGLIYLFAWPGMDPKEFCEGRVSVPPTATDYLSAIAKTLIGASLIWIAARQLMPLNTLAAVWVGMLGLALLLHFGLLHLVALLWRNARYLATPLMNRPLSSRSLGELWGRRWNTGFSALAEQLIFRPLVAWVGPSVAMGCVFFFSGLIHDAVISLPARGGFGRPTLYFMLQFVGLLMQRSRVATRLGMRAGARGRLFALVVALTPLPLLFHAPFIHRVIIPFLAAIGAI
jgi:alginate O-acetyltransferase complex protein AlgI